jgi:hypothetical protein
MLQMHVGVPNIPCVPEVTAAVPGVTLPSIPTRVRYLFLNDRRYAVGVQTGRLSPVMARFAGGSMGRFHLFHNHGAQRAPWL